MASIMGAFAELRDPPSRHCRYPLGEILFAALSAVLSCVSCIMKLLGFTTQKPLYQAWQQDSTLVRQWEFETYPAIRAEAREVGATIYFGDDSGIRSDFHTGTTWAPPGCTPVVEATGKRFSLNMISAVGPQGEFRFMVHDGTVTASVFREFLGRLVIGAQKPIFLVLDGHPIHKAKLVQEPQAVLPAAVLAAPEPRRAGLGAREAQRLQAPRTNKGRDEAAGHRRSAPNPKVARAGEILLSPARMPICSYMTFLSEILVSAANTALQVSPCRYLAPLPRRRAISCGL